jgi:hypothetical protein
LRLKNAGDNPADPYKNCPNDSGRPRAQIGPDDGSLNSDLLFDQDIEEITVVGKQHRTINTPLTGSVIGTISFTITLDWTLKLERPPKKGKSADVSPGQRRTTRNHFTGARSPFQERAYSGFVGLATLRR